MFTQDVSMGKPASTSPQIPKFRDLCATKLHGRVLVVDDSSDGRMIVSKVLKCMGLCVESAEHGLDGYNKALAALQQHRPFDLILMDMHMPVMDGYSATTRLREVGYTGRIAALTADANEDARAKCLFAGCDDFANKPISVERLFELVRCNISPSGVPAKSLSDMCLS